MVYSRTVDGKDYTFGISGRLYKSNVLLYDRQTESLWSQLMARAVTGPLAGQALTQVPSSRMTWRQWRRLHPGTTVLSTDTGYDRDYAVDPYEGYYRLGGLMFPVGKVRRDLPAKQRVLGITVGGRAKAYALENLANAQERVVDRIGDSTITITIGVQGQVLSVVDSSGAALPHVFAYWFAWQAFYPDTEVEDN